VWLPHDGNRAVLWRVRRSQSCGSGGIFEKINYIHNNPVEEGLVSYPQDYVYSSARDYAGEVGLLRDVVVAR